MLYLLDDRQLLLSAFTKDYIKEHTQLYYHMHACSDTFIINVVCTEIWNNCGKMTAEYVFNITWTF